MDTRAQILELETSLLNIQFRKNRFFLDNVLADEFIEFGASGDVWGKTGIIEAMESEVSKVRVIDDFELRHIGCHVVLATYRCHHSHTSGSEHSSLRSSIWREDSDGWRLVFHQGTRIPGSSFFASG